LINTVVQKGAKYSSWLLKPVEYPLIQYYSKKEKKYFSVFIVGAPRTGSTIFYQIITNYFNVAYPDNLVNFYRRNAFIGFALSKFIFNGRAHNCYSSNFGNTDNCGLHAPNEFGQFWYRWLPRDRHFVTSETISKKKLRFLKENLKAIESYAGIPVVYKNLNMGQRLQLLAKLLPNTKIIWIKRDPFFTAQSIYHAKHKLKLSQSDWWSVMPKNVESLRKLESFEQIVKQIFYIERQIFLDKKLFADDQILEIYYESLNINFENIIEKSRMFIDRDLVFRNDYKKNEFKFSNIVRINNSESEQLKYWINKFDWQNYEI